MAFLNPYTNMHWYFERVESKICRGRLKEASLLPAVSAIQRHRSRFAGVLNICELRLVSREPAQPRTGGKAARWFFVFLWLVISVSCASLAAQTPTGQNVGNSPDTQDVSPPEPVLVPELPSIQPVPLPPPILLPDTWAPLLIAPPPPAASAPPVLTGLDSAQEAVRAILGLVALLALAYIGGHPKIQSLERKFGISHLVTTGLPFVILGAVAHLPAVRVLSDTVLYQIRPLLVLGLGWIGLSIGYRFNTKLVDALAPGMAATGVLTAAVPFALVVASCSLWFAIAEHSSGRALADDVFGRFAFFRDAILLGTAGAMTARSAPSILKGLGAERSAVRRIWSIVEVEQITGVAGLMLVAAYFRPQGALVSWQLPGTAWLFITLGAGAAMGVVIHAVFGKIRSGPEFSLLLLGSVAFTAGMGSFLRLSPVVLCFIVGVVMVNLPGGPKAQIREALIRLERPIYLLFLLIAGSLWHGWEWRGWTLMVLFVVARLFGKWISVRMCERRAVSFLSTSERVSLVFGPIGALSIAIVVNAQDLYSGPALPWMITAVVGGAIVTELIVQISALWHRRAQGEMLGQA